MKHMCTLPLLSKHISNRAPFRKHMCTTPLPSIHISLSPLSGNPKPPGGNSHPHLASSLHGSPLPPQITEISPATNLPSHKQQNKQVHIKNGNRSSKGIKLAHWNLGSAHLQNKMCEIERAVSLVKPAVFGISEANLHHTTDLSTVQIPGYRLFTAKTLQNPTIQMSRVVVFLRDDISGTLRSDLMDDDFSSIWIELSTPNSKKILVSNVYRDHQWMNQGQDKTSKSDDAVKQRWIVYLDQWTRAHATGAEIHCIGDFNIDSTKLTSSSGNNQPLVDKLLRTVLPLGMSQCAPGNTWTPQGLQRGQPSGLDHHWTNAPEKLSEVTALTIGHSDHKLISVVRFAKIVKLGQKFVKKRSYKKFDQTNFLEEVSKISWWQVYQCTDVDTAVARFTKLITSILDREDMAPMRVFQTRIRFASWLSDSTKQVMEERDAAMATYNVTKLRADWEVARELRNRVTRLLKTEKCNSMRQKVKQCEDEKDTSRVWRNIRGYLGWGGAAGAPTRLVDESGQLVTSPEKMAELQNNYYIQKVQTIREQLPKQGDPTATLRKAMEARPQPRQEGLVLKAVTPDEINEIIKKLKKSKSSGPDNIDTYIIKLIRPYIVPAITHIVNTSITTLKFPTMYKQAKVVPLYKSKDAVQTNPKSYRPIALLPVASKVLERCIHKQIMYYMESNQLWHPSHHAYRSHRSTTTAMLSMYDSWVSATERGELAGAALIDMSAAFDVVDTELLLEKCKLYNFERNTVQWLWSYLSERSQYTYIGGSQSSSKALEAGVPQGSILGPVLYTLYTCDFPEVIHQADCPNLNQESDGKYRTMCTECGGVVCYADDSTLTVTASSPEELSNKLSTKFQVMKSYLTENRLCINSDKTHLLVLCTEQKRRYIETEITLNTGTEIIFPTPVEKLVGFTVHQNLGFGEYLVHGKNSVVSTLSKRVGALKLVSKIASFKTRLSVCSALVMSRILYMLPLYAGAPDYMLSALQTKQSEAMRWVTKRKWTVRGLRMTSNKELLSQCGYLSVKQMAYFYSVAAVHKTLKYNEPEYLHGVLAEALASGVKHKYPTSEAGARQVVAATKVVANSSFRWRAATQFANLPAELKAEPSLKIFLSRLRHYTRVNIPI